MTDLPVVALVGLGLLFFASPLLVLVLVLALLSLRGRVRRLEARLAEIEQRSGSPAPAPAPAAPTAPAPESPVTPPPASDSPSAPREPAIAIAPVGPDAPAPVAASAPLERGPEPISALPPRDPGPAAPRAPVGVGQWEGWLGGTWLSRVGGVLLVLGIGFFLKHAFEHEWIGPTGRVLAGLAAGIAMLAGGVRLAGRDAYHVPAQSLIAVGAGVLHLSLYAAHTLYALVGAPTTFLGMAVVTAVGFATALRLDSGALAALATLGGLLTPVILDTGADRRGGALRLPPDPGRRRAARRGLGGDGRASRCSPSPGPRRSTGAGSTAGTRSTGSPAALGWATAFFLAFAAGALTGPRIAPAGRHRRARADAARPRRARAVLHRRPARPRHPPGRRLALAGARPGRPLLGDGANRGPERPRRAPRGALPPRGRAGVPGAGARGDARAAATW